MSVELPISRRYDIAAWLHANVETNDNSTNRDDPLAPWHVSVTAQTATWRGINHKWILRTQRNRATVQADPDIELLLAVKFS